MPEYNFWLHAKCSTSERCEKIKANLQSEAPYPNIIRPQIISTRSQELYLLWDVTVAEDSDEEHVDIINLLNFLFNDGMSEAYALFQSEWDESGIGFFLFVDKENTLDPMESELDDFIIFSGEEQGAAIFKENNVPSGFDSDEFDEEEDSFGIDVDNIVQCFECIRAAHKNGRLLTDFLA